MPGRVHRIYQVNSTANRKQLQVILYNTNKKHDISTVMIKKINPDLSN